MRNPVRYFRVARRSIWSSVDAPITIGILHSRATDRQWCARSKGYPRKITTRSSKIPYGLSSLTLWPFGKNGTRHPSTSQLHGLRDEHARQLLQGKHSFALSFVNSPHPHSHLPPLEAGDTQQTGPVSTGCPFMDFRRERAQINVARWWCEFTRITQAPAFHRVRSISWMQAGLCATFPRGVPIPIPTVTRQTSAWRSFCHLTDSCRDRRAPVFLC